MAPGADTTKTKGKAVIARVYIVRHGETQENRDGIIQGQLDTHLNALGKRQATLLGGHSIMRSLGIAKMMSSDLSRAVETATQVLVHHPGVELIKQPALRERMMGQLEGKKGGIVEPLKEDTTVEKPSVFAKRAVDWWKREVVDWSRSRSTQENTGPTPEIVVVTHGGFILTLLQTLLGSRKVKLDDGVKVGRCYNTSVTRIDVLENGKGIVRWFGRMEHLEEGTDALGSNADVDGST